MKRQRIDSKSLPDERDARGADGALGGVAATGARSPSPGLWGRFRRARLRTQLLLTFNLSVGLVLAGFLYADYRHDLRGRLAAKSLALGDEARTLAQAVDSLVTQGDQAVLRHIERVCAAMDAGESPGHTIEVRVGDKLLSTAHHAHQAPAQNDAIAGSATLGGLNIRIVERRAPLISQARTEGLRKALALGLAGVIGAAALNAVLLHLVSRPLERLVRSVRAIGRGRLGTPADIHANAELAELGQEITRMSAELARRDSDRTAQLERARRLQSHLIPVARAGAEVSVAIEYHPADEIAGDFVDVLACPNGDTLLCVADVVGHGIHAAMGSAVLKALLLATDLDEPSPGAMLATINRLFCRTSLPEDFASVVLVRISADSGHAVYASAGHEMGYLRHAGGDCEEIRSTGMVLGLDEEAQFDDAEFRLDRGDTLVLLSDGIREAMNTEGRQLGRTAVVSLVRAWRGSDAGELARRLIEAANHHRGGAPALDDMTVLAFGRVTPRRAVTVVARPDAEVLCDRLSGREPRSAPSNGKHVTTQTKESL